MLLVLLKVPRRTKYIIIVAFAKVQVPQDAVLQLLKCSARIEKYKEGIIEGICFQGRDDGCLQDVLEVNGDLVIALQ